MGRLFDPSVLLDWFDKNKRIYPWGENPTPYRVWISEIMLQQTVVTAVVPFFNRWMERFPSVEALARGTEEEVLRLWEGLGYYSRVRNILKAARVIQQEMDGIFPENEKALLSLPGIGGYTAGAVLSIALGQPVPAVDANVIRILQRLKAMSLVSEKAKQEFSRELASLIPSRCPGDFNCALMQLGQILCRPRGPLCLQCPLSPWCAAFKAGIQDSLPRRKSREKVEVTTRLYIFVKDDTVLLSPPGKGRFRGLYRFPSQLTADQHKLLEGITPVPLATRVHYYTRYKDTLEPFLYLLVNLPFPVPGTRVSLEARDDYPMPSVYRKIMNEVYQKLKL